MKKLLLILVAGAFMSISMNSCSKKCGHCEVNGGSGTKYCSTENHIMDWSPLAGVLVIVIGGAVYLYGAKKQ